MKRFSATACALLAALACASAEAGRRDDALYLPQFTVEMNFDDLVDRGTSDTHITASFGLRSSFEVVDAMRGASSAARATWSSPRHLFVPMLQLGGTAQGIDMARVLGRNTLRDPRSAVTGEGSGGSGWLWWAAGGLATAGVIALAADGGNNDVQEGDCTVVNPDPSSGGAFQGCDVP